MTHKVFIKAFGLLLILLSLNLINSVAVYAQDEKNYSTKPVKKGEERWRIGYLEAGKFADYQMNLIAIVNALMHLGWIEEQEIPPQSDNTDNKALWHWLANDIQSDYIEFVEDAYWSSNWKEDVRMQTKQAVLKRLNETKDIDLMLALGTWAALDLANNEHSVATVAASVADALQSNIIKSVDDSGYDHLHAKIDPTRNKRQLRLFHDIINFNQLGVVYENSVEGRSYSAVHDVEEVSQERGFSIVPCYAQFSDTPLEDAKKQVLDCYTELANKVNAVYVTRHRGLTPDVVEQIVPILNKKKVRSFSQQGSRDVILGVLMSIALAGHKYVGAFYAETVAKILNGAKPRDLPQVFEEPPKIAINITTAEKIGFEPPIEIYGIADEIYR